MAQSSSKKMTTHWKEAFAPLPSDLKNSLCFPAIHAAPVRKIRIQEFCGCMNVEPVKLGERAIYSKGTIRKNSWDQNKIKKVVDELQQLGWIDITAEGFFAL